ncbi:phage tail protein [Shewanella baltica]|uniref:phage tail protein n=1 Tax=Shewanella baltica TaxID=62322 RepID=UPI003D7A30AF
MSDPFIGEIIMFAGNFAPRGWAFCNGQLLSISQHSALFSILGTVYGGDGVTTFALPNLQSRSPVGTGAGGGLANIPLGQVSGTENVSLTTGQLPSHAPAVAVNVAIPAVAASTTAVGAPAATLNLGPVAAGGRAGTLYAADTPDVTLKPFAAGVTVTPVGGNLPVPIRNPYLGMNFIIALEGIYPSRN